MNIEDLVKLGATVCAGAIDFRNTQIGVCTSDGPVLTPDGEALIAQATGKGKRVRPKNTDVEDAVVLKTDA